MPRVPVSMNELLWRNFDLPTISWKTIGTDREREIAEAQSKLLRDAEANGVKPVSSLDDLAGDPELTADLDVEKFLRQVREDRGTPR